jgi:GNAT superfamily N-acetyltransferase
MPGPSIIQIAPAHVHDKSLLEALQMRASLAWEEYRAALLGNPEVVEVPSDQIADGRVLLARKNGVITGFAALELRADGDAELDGLFVDPGSWGEKIGTHLVSAAEDLALQRGCRALHVVANPRAEAFYQRCGFERCGDKQTAFGPAPDMRKPLS